MKMVQRHKQSLWKHRRICWTAETVCSTELELELQNLDSRAKQYMVMHIGVRA